ncbi:hypothetical protein [Halorientalis halophila]|uniref:hypothetical protein n=1 Tax=Halorientalis halophila TaxID=3108499 RepID=UPI00300BE314
MPRLMLDLPDELRRPGPGPESAENQTEDGRAQTRDPTETVTASGQPVGGPRVVRWHRCWAGTDGQ